MFHSNGSVMPEQEIVAACGAACVAGHPSAGSGQALARELFDTVGKRTGVSAPHKQCGVPHFVGCRNNQWRRARAEFAD